MARKKTVAAEPEQIIPETVITPEPKPHFPIVGIGASAGGLAAFEAFFSGMPADKDPGMAFVLVQHLAPDHKSILTDLIRRYTRMEVFEVTDGVEVQPIGTVFVDFQLRILRFTPGATQIINLILSDVGRSIGHFASNLIGYDSFTADIQAVLSTLIPKEVEVRTADGTCYMMRILPYRTVDNVIEGAVITFVNISEMKQTQEALKKANDQLRMAVVVRDSHDAVVMQDMEGCIMSWNPAAVRMYGWNETEALQRNIRELTPEGLREADITRVQQLSRKEVLEPYRTQRIAKDGAVVEVWLTATALLNEVGEVYAIATTERASGIGE